jgi:hypothetical protein
MRRAGPVAALVADSVDPRGLQLAAWRRAYLVNSALDALADRAVQRHAARRRYLGAAHDGVVGR